MGGTASASRQHRPEVCRALRGASSWLRGSGPFGVQRGGDTIHGIRRLQSPLWLTPTAGQSPPRGAPGLQSPAPRLVTCSDLGLSLFPQELLLFLQNLPTAHWGNEDISLLLAEAYRLKFAFADAPNHYKK